MAVGLYIHVPFCTAKCPYCDFYSVKLDNRASGYKAAVLRNLSDFNERFDSVYFGGGTPILLYNEIAEILTAIKPKLCENAEITLEANPCVTDEKALKTLVNAGMNRISFGVQSCIDSELATLGRRHSFEQAKKAILLAKRCGITNISADLMLAIPNQTRETLKTSIERLCELPLSHVSAYLLKIEKSTPFYERELPLPDEDETAEMYLDTVRQLSENGFTQYEISNFARHGFECRHNLKYWRCEKYVGVGPAAHSYYNGKRYGVPRDLDKFITSDKQEIVITDEAPHTFEEWAMLRLRLTEGINFSECVAFGITREKLLGKCRLIPANMLKITDSGIRITAEGFLLSNEIITRIIS